MAVIGNFLGAAGENDVNPAPALTMHESEVVVPGDRRSVRARRLLHRVRRGRRGARGRVHHVSDAARRAADEGRQDARGVREGQHAAQPHRCRGPIVRSSPTTCVGGEEGIGDAGVSVARLIPESLAVPRSDRPGVSRRLGRHLPVERARRSELRRPPARLPGHHRIDQHRFRRVVLARAQRDRASSTASTPAGSRRICSASTRPYRWRPLQRSIYRSFIGRTEWIWSRREQPADVRSGDGLLRVGRLPVRAPLVRRRPLRSLGARRRCVAARHGRIAAADLLAERVQPGPRPVPADELRRWTDGQRSSCSSSCFRSARTARIRFSRVVVT